jgi:dTDP-4-amino-4,6-dideoxygalactose transaminase
MKSIGIANPAADLAPLRKQLLAAIARVIETGTYILGPEVEAFEKQLAARLGVGGAVGVGSGTEALVLALLAAGVEPGDEVITVSHTAGATVAAVQMIGAIPVLVDIEDETYCLDPNSLEGAMGPRTRAIISVHLYGHPANLEKICAIGKLHDIPVIEDCAQAQEASISGRPVGSIGEFGCFSFYPTKNLGAIGDGGLVVAKCPKHVELLRQLRTYGWTKPQFSEVPRGRCTRLDELQAAILRVRLRRLTAEINRRRAIARNYNKAFRKLPVRTPKELAGYRHVYHLYVIRCSVREALARHLKKAGIMTGRHYPYPVHRQPGLAKSARVPKRLIVTEAVSKEILSLPLYPSMSKKQQQKVIDAVQGFFSGN